MIILNSPVAYLASNYQAIKLHFFFLITQQVLQIQFSSNQNFVDFIRFLNFYPNLINFDQYFYQLLEFRLQHH